MLDQIRTTERILLCVVGQIHVIESALKYIIRHILQEISSDIREFALIFSVSI